MSLVGWNGSENKKHFWEKRSNKLTKLIITQNREIDMIEELIKEQIREI